MQLAEITSYIQTILPLIHGEKDWCAWVFMQETAFCVTRNKQRPQTLEERILMRNLSSQLPSPSISITSSHLCFQFITENSNKINQLYCIKTKEIELVIAGKAVSELQIELIQSGFQQEARKMQLKKQSIHMIHRLQENQQRLQQEIEHYKNLQNSSIQTQINQWILQQSQEIIVSPAVIDLLQQSLTPIAVNSVLDQALRLALYLKIDSNTTLTLLPEHIELEIEERKVYKATGFKIEQNFC
jgi:hypothetical protein